jgi:hypothetical protein
MSYVSSVLSSLRSLDFPVNVHTANGTPIHVVSRGTLSASSFYVPNVSHVPRLTMNLFSADHIIDSSYRVILDVDSCSVQDRRTQIISSTHPSNPGVVRNSQGYYSFLDAKRLRTGALCAHLAIC